MPLMSTTGWCSVSTLLCMTELFLARPAPTLRTSGVWSTWKTKQGSGRLGRSKTGYDLVVRPVLRRPDSLPRPRSSKPCAARRVKAELPPHPRLFRPPPPSSRPGALVADGALITDCAGCDNFRRNWRPGRKSRWKSVQSAERCGKRIFLPGPCRASLEENRSLPKKSPNLDLGFRGDSAQPAQRAAGSPPLWFIAPGGSWGLEPGGGRKSD